MLHNGMNSEAEGSHIVADFASHGREPKQKNASTEKNTLQTHHNGLWNVLESYE